MGKGRFSFALIVTISAIVIAGLVWFNYYSSYSFRYDSYLLGNILGLFWVPMLSILLLREDMSAFGFSLSKSKRIWPVVGISFACVVAAMIFVMHWPDYQNYYPLFRRYPEFADAFREYPRYNPFLSDPLLMLYAEVSYGFYLFCWEFFFRGYLLFGLMKSIGWWAVLIQAIAFGLLHCGKPATEIVSSFGAGLILGIIALNAKSFIPGFVLHWAASIAFDIMIVTARPH